jgi:hypothetical protein
MIGVTDATHKAQLPSKQANKQTSKQANKQTNNKPRVATVPQPMPHDE